MDGGGQQRSLFQEGQWWVAALRIRGRSDQGERAQRTKQLEVGNSSRRRAPLGFTLPEILVVLVLLSVLSFSLLLNVRASSDRLKSEGLAQALASELRAARALATRDQAEVLVALPATSGGGVCRSFRIYVGEGRLRPLRTLGFDQEYDSYIIAATWPTAGEWETAPSLDPARLAGLGEVNAILFRPDGTIRTNLPRLQGMVCLAVDHAVDMTSGEGTWGVLRATASPNTVVVTPSGVVRLEKGLFGLEGALATSTTAPALLTLAPPSEEEDSVPVIESIAFSPKGSIAGDGSGLGKTYIEIHPLSGEGRAKEYGMATITAEASDAGGGPLTMQVKVQASAGSAGSLAADGPVRMEYLDGRWVGTVGWRPPADASPDVRYDFEVEIANAQGGKATAASDASVLPVLRTLNDFRLAIETSEQVVYLSNLDGGELVRITPPGLKEELPIWSGDGTKLYVLAQDATSYVFVRYNADGTEREVVSRFPPDATDFSIEPAGMYLKYLHGTSTVALNVLGKEGPATDELTTYTLSALHISNGGHPVAIASGVAGGGTWLPNVKGLFQYTVATVEQEEGPAYGDDGLPIEGETAMYDKVNLSTYYNTLTGLGPSVGSYTVEHPIDAVDASFNPYDPNYFTLRQPGKDDNPSSFALFRYKPEDRSWGVNTELAQGLSLAEPASWSANGEWLAYLVETGETSRQLRVQRVTLPDEGAPEDATASFGTPRSVNFPGGVLNPRPTPDGEHVLYIDLRDGSKLMRMPTSGDGNPLRIGTELEGVVSFAITQ